MSVSKDELGYFVKDEDYSSEHFLLITLSLLESKGYLGFIQLFSIIEDYQVMIKLLRLMNGLDIKVPPIKEFYKSLKTCVYIYLRLLKNQEAIKTLDLSQADLVDAEKEFKNWVDYLGKQGYNIKDFFGKYVKINVNNPIYRKVKKKRKYVRKHQETQ